MDHQGGNSREVVEGPCRQDRNPWCVRGVAISECGV
jgi:hypothetical protein